MNDINFFRIDKNNVNLIENDIDINNEKIKKEKIEEFVQSSDNYLFVGIFEEEVIALLYGYGMLRPDGKQMFYIHSVDVEKNYQSKGIGTELMKFVIEYISKENIFYKFFVLAENDNIKACKLYQKYANKDEQVLFSKEI